jgi:Undecaprenyl-phosphate galactose phosphotransferase WbaP
MTLSDFELWYRSRYQRTSSAFTSLAFIAADLFGVMFSFGTGFFLVNAYDIRAINFKSFVTYWPYLPVFILVFQVMSLYPGISLAPSEVTRRFSIGSLMAHGGIILSRYIEDKEFDAISIAFIISCWLAPMVLMFCRDLTHIILGKLKINGIPAVIYGGGNTGRVVVDRLLDSKKSGYAPVLILDNEALEDKYRGIPIIRDTGAGPEIVQRFHIKMAIVAMPQLNREEMARLLNYSVSAFRYNVLIPDFFNVTNIWWSIRDFDGILGLATSHQLKMPWNLGAKRFMDVSLVIAAGLILLPFLLVIALLVKISSPGPVLYGHPRLGRRGKPFNAYKFRSMVMDADKKLKDLLESDPKLRAEWESGYKLKDDPRITKIGKFLRRTSLDEFPQLINILLGDMSLVGPRPVVEAEAEKYGEDFRRIFSVKPGLTGLWQVSGRSDTDYTERISFDTYYLQSWSIWLDLWVLYKTPWVVVQGRGAY